MIKIPEFLRQNRDGSISEEIVVRPKWVTPDADAEIGHIARVSNPAASLGDESSRLISYLLRKQHWSPFQMANMCVEVHTTRDISAQILRHASFGFQEFSTRYASVEELQTYKECRFQHPTNRQSSLTVQEVLKSASALSKHPAPFDDVELNGYSILETEAWWNEIVRHSAGWSEEKYKQALKRGIAKEVARSILPFGLCPTTLYINGTIRNWIHYIALRGEMGTQKEHRIIANGAYDVMRHYLPDTTAAFDLWHRTNLIKERLYTLIMNADDQGTVDLISDAMSDVHDMDTGIPDFAKAALAALVKEANNL